MSVLIVGFSLEGVGAGMPIRSMASFIHHGISSSSVLVLDNNIDDVRVCDAPPLDRALLEASVAEEVRLGALVTLDDVITGLLEAIKLAFTELTRPCRGLCRFAD